MSSDPQGLHRSIFEGDNLHVLRGMNSDSVDLIYLDPPFNSKKTYSAPIGSEAAGAAFKDTWTLSDVDLLDHNRLKTENRSLYALIYTAGESHSRGMFSYLMMMAPRLIECERVLRPEGSIYLHCDPTAESYLRVLMDAVFGKDRFQELITWKRTYAHGDRMFGRVTDQILFYSAGAPDVRADARIPLSPEYLRKQFRFRDSLGRFRVITLTGPKTSPGESGKPWRGVDPTKSGRCWSVPKTGRIAEWIEANVIPGYRSIAGVHARLDALEDAGLIHWPAKKGGTPQLKRYLMEDDGMMPSNLWADIKPLNTHSKERVGYPTQKPLALLERIIKASSNEGDLVLDPFCGCATTMVAAEMLGRKWVGIDLSALAAQLVVRRVKQKKDLFSFQDIHHQQTVPTRTDVARSKASTPRQRDALKRTLFREQGGCCNLCHHQFPEPRHFHMDHILPKARGGEDWEDNFQLLCASCNGIKGTSTQEEARARLVAVQGIDFVPFGEAPPEPQPFYERVAEETATLKKASD